MHTLRNLLTAIMLGLMAASAAFADTCTCDSPCSGSVSCSGGGCYAYCEENPENSGRHVCVKGCATEDSSAAEHDGADSAGPPDKAPPARTEAE
jgi:hypothetical protein